MVKIRFDGKNLGSAKAHFLKIKNQKWSKININTKLKNKKIKKSKARL